MAPGDRVRRLADATPRANLLKVPGAAQVVQHEAAGVVAAAIVSHSAVAVPNLGLEQSVGKFSANWGSKDGELLCSVASPEI